MSARGEAKRGGGLRAARAGRAVGARKTDALAVVAAPCRCVDLSPLPGTSAGLVIHETDENGAGLPELAAAVDGVDVGWITWAPDGTVLGIGVDEAYRRQGIATALWQVARGTCPSLRHDGELITEDGLAFALTVEAPWTTGAPPLRATLT